MSDEGTPELSTAAKRPTMVTDIGGSRLLIEIGDSEPVEPFTRLGFKKTRNYSQVYTFQAEETAVFRMCETLRDMGVPFSTHRHMGADYQVQYLREKATSKESSSA